MPAFDRLNGVAGKAVDRLYGEAIQIVGRLDSQYSARTVDPARAAFTTRGIFTDDPDVVDIAAQRAGNSLPGVSRFSDGEVTIQIVAAYAAAMPWTPTKGDLVRLTERAGSPSYAISDPRPADHGDLVLILVREPS